MSTQTEQEQLEELKNFWTEYGKPIFIGILLAVAVLAGWKFWKSHQLTNQIREAQSYQLLVFTMMQPSDKINVSEIQTAAQQLQTDNPNSYYAQYAKFYLAKLAVDTGKLDEAAKALQEVLAKPADVVIGELARQRLAQVLSAQGKVDDALKLLDAPLDNAFIVSRQELKGDLLLTQGNVDQARAVYKEALVAAEAEKSPNQLIIKIKLNDLAKEGV